MMSDQRNPLKRRDVLTTSAFSLAALGAALASWPLFVAMGPDAETRARRKLFALKDLDTHGRALIPVDDFPVLIFRRTEQELVHLRATVPNPPTSRHQNSETFWYRSVKPEIMVCVAYCRKEPCIVSLREFDPAEMKCPCCGSTYDLAGRKLRGPTPGDLMVPVYRFISSGEIEFESMQRS